MTINYGAFLNTVTSFVIVAFAVFLLVRAINRLRRQQEASPAQPTTKDCPFCRSTIALMASRCPQCTSPLTAS